MDQFHSNHFFIQRTEDGWILQARVTKDVEGDWLLNHDQLVELQELMTLAMRE